MDHTNLTPEKQAVALAVAHPTDIVALYALNSLCVYASPSHEDILGNSPKAMVGKAWTEVVAPEDHAHANLAGDDAMLNGQSIEFGLRALTKSGARVTLRGKARIIIDPPTRTGYLLFQASVVKA